MPSRKRKADGSEEKRNQKGIEEARKAIRANDKFKQLDEEEMKAEEKEIAKPCTCQTGNACDSCRARNRAVCRYGNETGHCVNGKLLAWRDTTCVPCLDRAAVLRDLRPARLPRVNGTLDHWAKRHKGADLNDNESRGRLLKEFTAFIKWREPLYATLTEHCDWEAETWRFYIPVDGNEDAIADLDHLIGQNQSYELDTFDLVTESDVNARVAGANGGYMLDQNKVEGRIRCPDDLDQLYTGGLMG